MTKPTPDRAAELLAKHDPFRIRERARLAMLRQLAEQREAEYREQLTPAERSYLDD